MTSRWKSLVSITIKKRRVSRKAIFALVFYLIMPIIAIFMIINAYPELSRERLIGILVRTVPVGFMLILVSQFAVRYEKGDKGRLVLNEIYVLLVLLWLFALLGGQPVIFQTWEEYNFSLHIWNYLVLILFVISMNVLYYIFEYQAYRGKDVADNGSEIQDPSAIKVQKHREVIITTSQVQ